jgi:predicted transcriptional regulator
MRQSKLKEETLSMLQGTEDEAVIRVVHNILQQSKAVYHLDEAQLSAVKEAEEQYARGEAMSHEEAEKEIAKWLKG